MHARLGSTKTDRRLGYDIRVSLGRRIHRLSEMARGRRRESRRGRNVMRKWAYVIERLCTTGLGDGAMYDVGETMNDHSHCHSER